MTYIKKRINFEVFHVLTDGTGASEFVRELVKNYLYLAHHEDGLENVVLSEYSRAFSIRKQMDLKDIIPTRQTAKGEKTGSASASRKPA